MTLDPQKTALLVIDVQNEYFDGKWPIPDGAMALQKIERAIDTSQSAGASVVYIQHAVLKPERGIFIPGSHGFELHPRLHPRTNDSRVVKNYPGSFSKTDLRKYPTSTRYRYDRHLWVHDSYVLRYNCKRRLSARLSGLVSQRRHSYS